MRASISKAVRHAAGEVGAGARLNLLPRLPPPPPSREGQERRGREKRLPLLLHLSEPWLAKPRILFVRAMYIYNACKCH